jgi:3-(3-hydroxy-phenyl)propionate hydroxylase
VLDVVPAGGGDFTDTVAWAPLLCTTHGPVAQPVSAPPSRSSAR